MVTKHAINYGIYHFWWQNTEADRRVLLSNKGDSFGFPYNVGLRRIPREDPCTHAVDFFSLDLSPSLPQQFCRISLTPKIPSLFLRR
jgi:hypothetical protein